jgi:hypothetical protein
MRKKAKMHSGSEKKQSPRRRRSEPNGAENVGVERQEEADASEQKKTTEIWSILAMKGTWPWSDSRVIEEKRKN